MVLFIKHIGIEGPGTLKTFFRDQGIQDRTIELQDGEALPGTLKGIEAVVSLGGPMNVYEEDKYPFLKEEHSFLRRVIDERIPFLGICLGSQLLAKACGARVGRSPEKEIGFFPIQFTEEGQKDPLFEGLEGRIEVFQWHEDMFAIPEKAELLASSEGCPHQAFKVGPMAYGLQFHVEITEPMIREWTEVYFSEEDSFRQQQARIMVEEYRKKEKTLCDTAEKIYGNFLKMIHARETKTKVKG